MSIELTNLEASRMYELLAESERLHARIAELERALVHSGLAFDGILHELGIPGDGYPAPVSNAVDFAKEAFAEIKSVLGKGE